MSSDLLLARSNLDKDFLDLAVGEPYIQQEIFNEIYGIDSFKLSSDKLFEYQPPNGHPELVKFLENKYRAKIIITTGAKQAIFASLYAFKKHGIKSIGVRTPYWFAWPSTVSHAGLRMASGEDNYESYLLVAPDNPDGFIMPYKELKQKCAEFRAKNIPVIHDGAYFSRSYLPEKYLRDEFHEQVLGDLQIFSISKMFGLSGLRLGYIVCKNETFYKDILEFMEMSSVGTSSISQDFFLSLLNRNQKCPELENLFIEKVKNKLYLCRLIFKHHIKNNIIEIPEQEQYGMFAWVKLKQEIDFDKLKIKVAKGSMFGAEDNMIRINLAVGTPILNQVINRINNNRIEKSLDDFFGKWPGDETDEELMKKLKED